MGATDWFSIEKFLEVLGGHGGAPLPAWIWERRVEPNAGLAIMFYAERVNKSVVRCSLQNLCALQHNPALRLGVPLRYIFLVLYWNRV